MFGLKPEIYRVLKKLNTPIKIQDFLESLPYNYEKEGETCSSAEKALMRGNAHCIEGALIAALALKIQGKKALLLDLKSIGKGIDDDHVVALYRENGYWGAISKTNHAVLRFRDPIYKTIRELALSYFHEYFLLSTGKKTLRSYSRPFSLNRFGNDWITGSEDLWHVAQALDESAHYNLIPAKNMRGIRPASPHEREAIKNVEWKKSHPRT